MKDPNEIRDVAGELLNIMTGNFKSNLCDAGLDCKLQPPEVTLTDRFRHAAPCRAAAWSTWPSAPATSSSSWTSPPIRGTTRPIVGK